MKIELKLEKIFFYIHNVDECKDILLHCNILCSQLSFTANMKKNPGLKDYCHIIIIKEEVDIENRSRVLAQDFSLYFNDILYIYLKIV
jgi:hypothetical protein